MGTGMSKVVEGLYLGNIRDSEDRENLTKNRVTHILSVHNNARPVLEDMTYLCISVSDSSSQNLIQHFKEGIRFIHECRLQGGGCLIHCLAGVSRSTTILVAYLMTVTNLSWEECLAATKAVRSYVSPNFGFQQQLQEYEMTLLKEILLLVRNLKDTAVSYFHFYNNMPPLPSFSSWDEYFAAFMNGKLCWGSYFDYLVEWNKHMDDENIMAITYEELKENQMLGLKKIADFFGFSLSKEEIQTVAEKSSFKAMKEKSSETHGIFGKILFRKGMVGDWKDLFSEAQNKEMDRKFEECLAGTNLGEKMKYGLYCKP